MHWTPQGERVEDPALAQLDYAEQHESGQLRLGVAGEQRELLPLSDEKIPHGFTEWGNSWSICGDCGRKLFALEWQTHRCGDAV